MTLEIDTENLLKEKAETIKRLQKQILEFTRELHSSNKEIIELKEQIEKMKCCGNCKFQEIEDYTGCPICNISNCNFNSKWELKE